MASRLEAVFALIDKASGPGAAIAKSLDRVSTAGSGITGSIGDAIQKIGERAKGAAGDFKSLADGIGKAVLVSLGFATAAAGMVFEIGKFAIEASEAKEKAVGSLELIDGAAVSAEDTLGRLKDAANATGQSRESLLAMYQNLRQIGFSSSMAEAQVSSMLDVMSLKGEEGGHALETLFEKIAAGGKFDVNAKSLAKVGISNEALDDALRSIDRYKNATNAQLKAAMDAGQISATEGVNAILGAVNSAYDKGKGLGSRAEQLLGNSFGGRIQAVKNEIAGLFEDFNADPLKDALKTLQETLASPAGAKAVKAINDLLAELATKLGSLATPENVTKLIEGFGRFVEILIDVGKAVTEGFGGGFMAVMQPVLDVFRDLTGSADGLGSIAVVFGLLAKVAGFVAAAFLVGLGVIGAVLYGLEGVVETVVGFVSDHWVAFSILFGAICTTLGVLVWGVGLSFAGAWAAAMWPIAAVIASVLAIYGVVKLLGPVFNAAIAWVGAELEKFGGFLVHAWDAVTSWAGKVLASFVGAFAGIAMAVLDGFAAVLGFFVDGLAWLIVAVVDGVVAIVDFFVDGFVGIVTAVADVGVSLYKAAGDMIDGLWNGIKDGWKTLIEDFKGLVDLLPDAVKQVLGIHSPSLVFKDLGLNTMAGFDAGLGEGAANTNATMADIAEGVASSATSPSGASGGGRQGGPTELHIHVTVQAGAGATEADGRAYGQGVARGLREELGDVIEEIGLEMGAIEAA